MWDQGQGRGRGPWAPASLFYHPFFCVSNLSQGPSGPPGSTGQKVMGLDLEGWVPEGSVGPTELRREVTLGTELAIPSNTPIGPRGGCHSPQSGGLAGLGVLPVVCPPAVTEAT